MAQLRRSGLARQQTHNSMAAVRIPRSARPSLTQAASPIPSAAPQHSLVCRVAAERDSSRGTNNFNSIDFDNLLPSDVQECPHGELGPLLWGRCCMLAANLPLLTTTCCPVLLCACELPLQETLRVSGCSSRQHAAGAKQPSTQPQATRFCNSSTAAAHSAALADPH